MGGFICAFRVKDEENEDEYQRQKIQYELQDQKKFYFIADIPEKACQIKEEQHGFNELSRKYFEFKQQSVQLVEKKEKLEKQIKDREQNGSPSKDGENYDDEIQQQEQAAFVAIIDEFTQFSQVFKENLKGMQKFLNTIYAKQHQLRLLQGEAKSQLEYLKSSNINNQTITLKINEGIDIPSATKLCINKKKEFFYIKVQIDGLDEDEYQFQTSQQIGSNPKWLNIFQIFQKSSNKNIEKEEENEKNIIPKTLLTQENFEKVKILKFNVYRQFQECDQLIGEAELNIEELKNQYVDKNIEINPKPEFEAFFKEQVEKPFISLTFQHLENPINFCQGILDKISQQQVIYSAIIENIPKEILDELSKPVTAEDLKELEQKLKIEPKGQQENQDQQQEKNVEKKNE